MAQGIQLPLIVTTGRLKLLSGDDYIEQLIYTSLGDGQSENPFLDLGLGESMIFNINDAVSEGEIRNALIRIFSTFERDQLARLPGDEAIKFERKNEGELHANVEYINMETQERVELDLPISRLSE